MTDTPYSICACGYALDANNAAAHRDCARPTVSAPTCATCGTGLVYDATPRPCPDGKPGCLALHSGPVYCPKCNPAASSPREEPAPPPAKCADGCALPVPHEPPCVDLYDRACGPESDPTPATDEEFDALLSAATGAAHRCGMYGGIHILANADAAEKAKAAVRSYVSSLRQQRDDATEAAERYRMGLDEIQAKGLLDEREADKARIAELEAALRGADELLGEAYEHWDADRDSQVGKILSAFAGHLPNYAPRATAFRAALSGARP